MLIYLFYIYSNFYDIGYYFILNNTKRHLHVNICNNNGSCHQFGSLPTKTKTNNKTGSYKLLWNNTFNYFNF